MVWLNLGQALICLSILPIATCTFRRGDRYWSGQPQSIGIDFSAHEATAVYTGTGSDNFTILARSKTARGTFYERYIRLLYETRDTFDGFPSILTTKEDEELFLWGVPFWFHKTKELAKEGKFVVCIVVNNYSIRLRYNRHFQNLCFPYEPETQFVPRTPWSSNMDLRSQPRISNLRWFRSPIRSAIETRDREFLLSAMTMLEEIKNTTRVEHKIEITSAMIVVPTWTTTRVNELFEEACALASIEVIGFPYNRVQEAATLVATSQPEKKDGLLILDHGDYYLDIHRLNWDKTRNSFTITEGMAMENGGVYSMSHYMTNKLLVAHSEEYQADRFKVDALRSGSAARQLLWDLYRSRIKINYGIGYPEGIALENRTLELNPIPEIQLNVTGQHVRDAEENYVNRISLNILSFLVDQEKGLEYIKTFPPSELEKLNSLAPDFGNVYSHLKTLIFTDPEAEIPAIAHPIDSLMILDGFDEEHLLRRAAERALVWKDSVEEEIAQEQRNMMAGMCVMPWEGSRAARPAKGAALRARDWIGGYNRWETNGRRLWNGGKRNKGYVHYL